MASRVLGAFAVTTTAALTCLVMATPASAHIPKASADCVKDKAVFTLNLTYYAGDGKNTVLIKDGNKVLKNEKFGQSYDYKLETDGTVEHKFSVSVKASDNTPYRNFDFEFKKDLAPCVDAPPKPDKPKPEQPPKPDQPKPPVNTTPEVPSSSETPPSSTPNAPAPGGSAPEPPLAATGASPLWLLLSGLGLVGAGAGTLLFLRRRRSA